MCYIATSSTRSECSDHLFCFLLDSGEVHGNVSMQLIIVGFQAMNVLHSLKYVCYSFKIMNPPK
jgi:hypothetical protein